MPSSPKLSVKADVPGSVPGLGVDVQCGTAGVLGNTARLARGFLHCRSVIVAISRKDGSRQSLKKYVPERFTAATAACAVAQSCRDHWPTQLEPFHCCPIEHRSHMSRDSLSVTVPSPLSSNRADGVDSGYVDVSQTCWAAAVVATSAQKEKATRMSVKACNPNRRASQQARSGGDRYREPAYLSKPIPVPLTLKPRALEGSGPAVCRTTLPVSTFTPRCR